jgi:hypothetical protein
VGSQTLPSTTQLQTRLEIWEEEAFFLGGGDVCRVITERSLIRAELGEDMVDGTWDGGEVGVVVGLSA